MARYTGSALFLKFNTTDLDTDFRTLDVSENITIVDASAGADLYKAKLTGQKDWTVTATLLDTAAGTVLWDALAPGTAGSLEWAPEGTANDKPRFYGTVYVSERSRSVPYEDVVELNVTFVCNSVVTVTIY